MKNYQKEKDLRGLPPDQFHEQIYELTINPTTGVPDYDSKVQLQEN